VYYANCFFLDSASGLETALRELAAIVDEVAITELDVVGSNPQTYRQAVEACYHVPTCVGVTTWEVRDETDDQNKALFKINYDPKDAYYAIADWLKTLQN
jgi:endo-1,4-beta-xylanase